MNKNKRKINVIYVFIMRRKRTTKIYVIMIIMRENRHTKKNEFKAHMKIRIVTTFEMNEKKSVR